MNISLEGKIALVTGASRGIGQAIAIELGKCGAVVIGTSTHEAGVNHMTDVFRDERVSGRGYLLDVCDFASIKTFFKTLTEEYGAPMILVNNAAVTQDSLFVRMKEEQWHRVIDVNLNALFYITREAIRPMLKERWGRIINITSIVAVTGNPGQANYCASKAGLIGLTKSIAQEIAARGITCNAVAPGFIDTDMTQQLSESQREVINEKIPMRRIGKPEDIAHMVAFLASDQAAYITGQTLNVNGGMCMV